MKFFRVLTILLLALFITISCGGDEDEGKHNGFYKVTKHVSQMSCTGDSIPIEGEFKFFKIKQESFFGATINTLYECENNSEDSCDMEYGKWLSDNNMSSGYENECNISTTSYNITSDSNGITITNTSKRAELTLKDGEECGTDLVDKYNDQLKCDSIEVIKGDRL